MSENHILVTRSSMPSIDEYIEEIADLFDSHWLTNMGPKHQQLKTRVKDYLGVQNVSLFVNGHIALEIALNSLDLKGEVITTPFTFASTTHAIVRNGLKPVFCDIKSDDYTIDPDKIEALINENTCAILPVHVYGNVCDVQRIHDLAEKYNLKVIYDAAHAFGVTYRGQGIGTFGDLSMFSFHATKVFNSIEGGCLAFSDDSLIRKLSLLKNFGISGPESVEYVGGNGKMNEFCAAMGLCNLKHLDAEIAKRKSVVEHYRKLLASCRGITLCPIQEEVSSNYSYFPIYVDSEVANCTRDDIYDELSKHGIYARKYFYPLTNDFECFGNQFGSDKTPIAKKIASGILTLPLYADLQLADVETIVSVIARRLSE